MLVLHLYISTIFILCFMYKKTIDFFKKVYSKPLFCLF